MPTIHIKNNAKTGDEKRHHVVYQEDNNEPLAHTEQINQKSDAIGNIEAMYRTLTDPNTLIKFEDGTQSHVIRGGKVIPLINASAYEE